MVDQKGSSIVDLQAKTDERLSAFVKTLSTEQKDAFTHLMALFLNNSHWQASSQIVTAINQVEEEEKIN